MRILAPALYLTPQENESSHKRVIYLPTGPAPRRGLGHGNSSALHIMASDLLLPILTILLQFVPAEQTGCSSQYLVRLQMQLTMVMHILAPSLVRWTKDQEFEEGGGGARL